jgi:hypothetical protein
MGKEEEVIKNHQQKKGRGNAVIRNRIDTF